MLTKFNLTFTKIIKIVSIVFRIEISGWFIAVVVVVIVVRFTISIGIALVILVCNLKLGTRLLENML